MKTLPLTVFLTCLFISFQLYCQTNKQKIKSITEITETETMAPEAKDYCTSTYPNTTDDWITNVTFNTINNSTGQEGPDSYGNYTWTHGTGLFVGQTYILYVSFNSLGLYTEHVWAWIDWNNDQDFDDPGEAYDLGEGIDATLSLAITVPNTAVVEITRMRVTEQYNSNPSPCDPHYNDFGETEDYSISINSNNYCFAQGGCDEYISEVEFITSNSIISYGNNCSGYYDWYSWSWPVLPKNGAIFITVTNGNPYETDQCGIWIDWNKDHDFDDPGESLSVTGSPGPGPYTAFIFPPAGAAITDYHLRTRIVYNQTPTACGTTIYGEVEDFHINVIPDIAYEWIGWKDNNWHNPLNWNTLIVPDPTKDVTIPDLIANKCWVYAGTANCNNITVEYGTGYDLRIYNQQLHVNGDMEFYGQLLMDHIDGEIIAEGNVDWYSGSRASIQANTTFWVHGDWTFRPGANVTLNNGIVDFTGIGGNFIRSYESNCYFNDIGVYKTGSDWISISNSSTADLHIHGSIYIQPNAVMYLYSPESVYLQGDLFNAGSLFGSDGTLVFNGTTQIIYENLSYTTTQYFNNLTINSSNSTSISNKNININGNLKLESGYFIANDFNITLTGDWQNQGTGSFLPGNGRVIFTGTPNSHLYGDENFNILELNKTGIALLNIDGPTITCQQYDWNSGGGISVRLGGEFTAYDLIDNGIYGGWGVDNTGGSINIYNYDGYVDLNGYVSMTGGVMNIYGGTTISYWPYSADATIHILYEGVVDFHDVGIYIFDSPTYTLTENIGGGTIRTAGGFWGESGSFAPDEGTVEFYGSGDALIYTTNACRLNDVIVNKGSKGETTETENYFPIIDIRSGQTLSDGSKSNTLTLIDNLIIDGNLEINNGVLNCDGYDIQIAGNWSNYVGDAGFVESTGKVIFVGAEEAGILTNEIFANVDVNRGTVDYFALEVPDNIVIDVTGDIIILDGILNLNPYAKLRVDDYLFIGSGAGLHSTSGCEIEIGGDYANGNPVNNTTQGFYGGGELVIFNGGSDQSLSSYAPEEYFTNLHINKTGGFFRPAKHIRVGAFMVIFNGDWWDQGTGLNHKFEGDILIEADGGYLPLGTTTIQGSGDQFYTNNGGLAMFEDLVIDKSGSLFLNSDMVVFNNFETTIEEGTLNLNGHLFKSDGNIYINDGGNMLVNAGAFLSIVSSLYVNSGGVLTASGEAENNATIFKDVLGSYAFEVNSGGTISANHATFTHMNPNGIWVKYGAIVDPLNAFNNCTFGGGENGFGAIRLTINNDQVLNLDNVSFIDNPFIAGSINVGKYYDWGELQFTNFSGNFSGPDYEDDQFNRIHWIPGEYRIEAKVFLEGPFNSTYMTPLLNPLLPLDHPFDPPLPYFGNPMPDWYYLAGGSVGYIPDPGVVDWVLVQLRDATSPATALPATTIATTPAFLMEDGTIIAMDGSTQLTFEFNPSNDLYLVIWHRNHLGVISANPLAEIGDFYSYDFSISASQAYGGSSAQVQLSSVPEIWGMIAGDADGNGEIQLQDMVNVWNFQAGNTGYLQSDLNLDRQSDNKDKNDYWILNLGAGSYIPE